MSETTDHQALATFLREYAEPRYPALAFVKHTANESLNGSHKVATKSGAVPLDVLRGGAMLVRAGVWDFEFIYPNLTKIDNAPPLRYRGLAIELKTPKGTLSDDQRRWGTHYQQQLWMTFVTVEWTRAAALLVRWVGGDPSEFEGLEAR